MEATPFQLAGCVFCLEPAAERIDGFATEVRRERAVVTAKNARQALFVKFDATDARLIALACRAVRGPNGSSLRFGFACSVDTAAVRPQRAAQATSAHTLAQAGDLAAAARDGEVLIAPALGARLAGIGFEFRSKEVHLPGGRTALGCRLDAIAVDSADASPDDRPRAVDCERKLADLGDALRALALRVEAVEATPRGQDGVESRQQAMLGSLAHATQRLEAITSDAAAVSQRLEQAQQAAAALDARLARCRDDQRALLAHHDGLAALRAQVEVLLGRIGETDERIALIEARRRTVEEVQSSAERVAHMLGDLQINLDMLGEQRAVIDDVGEKLARLDFSLQEAHNTLRALQRERELAERIEQGIKALRARSRIGAER